MHGKRGNIGECVGMGEPTLSSGGTQGKPQRVRISTETRILA